jgi:hypothetical protein
MKYLLTLLKKIDAMIDGDLNVQRNSQGPSMFAVLHNMMMMTLMMMMMTLTMMMNSTLRW